jgi:hypothetical protein
MSFPWTGSAATAALLALVVTGCGSPTDTKAEAAADTKTSTTAPTKTAVPTPSASPSPAPDISALSATAIFAKAKAFALTADSVRMRGTAAEGRDKITLDVQMTKTGGQGTFSVAGAPLGIRVIGRTMYLQMTERFLRATGKREKASAAETAAMVQLMKDKWVKLSKAGDFEPMIVMTTRDTFFKTVFVPSGKLRKTAPRTVDGITSIGLNDGEGTLWVDARDARPVRLEGPAGSGEGFRFSDYNQLKAPVAPPAAQTIDGKAMGL